MPGHSTDAPCFSRSLKAITYICTYSIDMGTISRNFILLSLGVVVAPLGGRPMKRGPLVPVLQKKELVFRNLFPPFLHPQVR